MRKTKPKNDSLFTLRSFAFIALWGASYVAAWWTAVTLIQQAGSSLPPGSNNIIGTICVLLISALIQVQASERVLKRSMRGWTLYTILGIVITFFSFTFVLRTQFDSIILTAFSLLMPTPIIQTLWLRRRVNSAWLWLLSSFVATIAFVVPMSGSGPNTFLVTALLYGVIQGIAMRYLWMNPKETEKAKIQAAHEADSLEDRAARLEKAQESDSPLIDDQEQTQQREVR